MAEKKDFNPENDIEFSVVSKLKKKLKYSGDSSENNLMSDEPPTNINLSPSSPIISNEAHYRRGLFFDYNSTYFQELFATSKPVFPYVVVKDLNSLTQALKAASQQALFINWSVNPKAYEQLLPQISSKFPAVQIIICGSDLNQSKAKEIKDKYTFVKNFLGLPTTTDQLKKMLLLS